MKKLFILLACAATVVACSKDETIASFQGDAIKFGNPFVNKSTRLATYGDGTTLSTFNVWGTVTGTGTGAGTALIYDETAFSGGAVGDDSEWSVTETANVQYWVADAAYKFTAISPDYTSVTPDAAMPTAIEYTLANNKDLILAQETATGKASGNDAVPLTFSHLLSKAKFTVTSNAKNGYTHTVKDITVANFSNGTYNITEGTWTGGTGANVTAPYAVFEDITNTTVANDDILLIPNTADFAVTFTVDFYKGTTLLKSTNVTKTVTTDLKAGNAYNFTIALDAGEEIKFSVDEIKAWTPNPGGDVTVQ